MRELVDPAREVPGKECWFPASQYADLSMPHAAPLLICPLVTCRNSLVCGTPPPTSAPYSLPLLPAHHSIRSHLASAEASVPIPAQQEPQATASRLPFRHTWELGRAATAAEQPRGPPRDSGHHDCSNCFFLQSPSQALCMLMVQVRSPLDCSGIFLASRPVCPVD